MAEIENSQVYDCLTWNVDLGSKVPSALVGLEVIEIASLQTSSNRRPMCRFP